MYDDYDDYLIDDINDQIDELQSEIEDADDMYRDEVSGIDEYWDRENQYIMDSDVYTDEEKQSIIDQHELERYTRKEAAKSRHESDLYYLDSEREQLENDLEQARLDREMEQTMRENERLSRQLAVNDRTYYPPQKKPSFISRALTAAAIYHFLKKLF